MNTYSCCLRYLSLVFLQYLINIFTGSLGVQQAQILQKKLYITGYDQNCNMSIIFLDFQLHKGQKEFIGIFEIRVAQWPQKILQSNLSYNLR